MSIPNSPSFDNNDSFSNSTQIQNNTTNNNIDDPEAHIKNLSSYGIPNSIRNYNTSNASINSNQTFMNKRHSFVWRKEFDSAFKKISVLSKLKSTRLQHNNTRTNNNNIDLKNILQQQFNSNILSQQEINDLYTQQLASDLIDSLLSGSPAALFASTTFLRDEHGKKRAPLLLAMLGVRVDHIDDINTISMQNYFLIDDNKIEKFYNIHDANERLNNMVKNRSNFIHNIHSDNDISNNNNNNNNLQYIQSHIRDTTMLAPALTNITSTDSLPLPIQQQTDDDILNLKNKKILPNHNNANTTNNNNRHHHHYHHSSNTSNKLPNSSSFFSITLEYGIGENRMKWSVIKSYKELAQLHSRLKRVSFQINTINSLYIDHNRYHKMKLPHFPRVFDYPTNNNHNDDNNNNPSSPLNHSNSNLDLNNNNYSSANDQSISLHMRIEKYLRLLNLSLCLRPQANRLFQFYEFSPISNLLSYENGFKGKEDYVNIGSTATQQGWRVSHFPRLKDFNEMIERHTTKWCLIRHSYITYVSDLHSTTPLDVFLITNDFQIKLASSNQNLLDIKDLNWESNELNHLSTSFIINLENTERKLQLIIKKQNLFKQWVLSIYNMVNSISAKHWLSKHRFDSFAPIRSNAFCKLLVDGRDYFWALSDALLMAQDVIYIHDWWLSPELYLRRPVDANQEFRIDRLLKKKAEEGVKIFIIVYRNVGSTVGTDSLWTKHSMLLLHDNIHLVRSPNQWLQNTYFWAHHEKFTIVDNTIAFIGGIDLCYGRYDTPDHVLRDDYSELEKQTFPGKDYSNARVCDFFELNKPFESMYDRNELPRMPWHDVHMMTVGEPARDLARHFVQRWNYVLRQKRPSRPTPLLTPISDFTMNELSNSPFFKLLKPKSTCEVQIVRSAGYWSLGLKETEKSIQNAYLKLIETSEHYIYIENQFFVTTSNWDGVVIENKIGNAIVDRIIRAHTEGTTWKAMILIPLMPGFDSPVDTPEASSLRLIMQCQYQCISRGKTSIFAKLRKLNIEPLKYIQFFSLRKWSTIGPFEKLVTEQLYIHAKILIADDRSCIIGSANINERSQLGNRDSEVAIVVRDTELIKTKMNGKTYYAARFAWEMRQRLMREHLGCDVDLVEIVERQFCRLKELAKDNYKTLHTNSDKAKKLAKISSAMIELAYREVFDCECSSQWSKKYPSCKNHGIIKGLDDDEEGSNNKENVLKDYDTVSGSAAMENPIDKKTKLPNNKKRGQQLNNSYRSRTDSKHPSDDKFYKCFIAPSHSFNYRAGTDNLGISDKKKLSTDPRLVNNMEHEKEVEGYGPDGWKEVTPQHKKSVSDQLKEWALEALSTRTFEGKRKPKTSFLPDQTDVENYLSDPDIKTTQKWDMLKRICYLQHLAYKMKNQKERQVQHKKEKRAKNTDENIQNYTDDFECENPTEDDTIEDFADNMLEQMAPSFKMNDETDSRLLNLTYVDPYSFADPLDDKFYSDLWLSVAMRNTFIFRQVFHCQPDNSVQTWTTYKEYEMLEEKFSQMQKRVFEMNMARNKNVDIGFDGIGGRGRGFSNSSKESDEKLKALKISLMGNAMYGSDQKVFDRKTAKKLLERIHGHLVVFPTEWLAREIESNNWFYSSDRLPPIEIFD